MQVRKVVIPVAGWGTRSLPATKNVPKEILLGDALCQSPTVRALSFTGSTPVGKKLMAQCAQTMKKLSLELGGNAPFLVFEKGDVEDAVRSAVGCKFRNAGQTCICANRFLVEDAVHDEFVERLKTEVGRIILGDGTQTGVTQGPLIDGKAFAFMQIGRAHV